MAGIIELKNVSFSAQDRTIIQDVTVEFDISKTTAIVGPSGSGKSTMLKLSAGILVPDEHGEVFYKGENIALMNRSENLEFRREGSFVFQDSALWANQNLFQILELPLKIHYPSMNSKERTDRIREVALEAGYRKDLTVRPAQLSMGEQKIIAFARAMLCNPELLFLDEWTESLDETSANRLISIIKRKKIEGTTVICVSHNMRIIRELSDYIHVIIDGKMSTRMKRDQIDNETQLDDLIKMGA